MHPSQLITSRKYAVAADGVDPTRYGLTDNRHYVLPDSATPLTVACGVVANTYGAWVQLTAGLANDIWVLSVLLSTDTPGYTYQAELGVGAAESEVVKWSGGLEAIELAGSNQSGWYPVLFAIEILANTRIAVRARCTAGGSGIYTSIQYKL